MGGIRSTEQECRFIKNLFNNLALKVDERDIFMQREYQTELDNKLGITNSPVPQVFVNGICLGVSEVSLGFVMSKEDELIRFGMFCSISLFVEVLIGCDFVDFYSTSVKKEQ